LYQQRKPIFTKSDIKQTGARTS